MVKVRRQARQ